MTIDYSEIDERCVELVKLFNKIGLNTEYSCEGHTEDSDFYIIFDESVRDDCIKNFLFRLSSHNELLVGEFYRWDRFTPNKDFLSNWIYSFPNRFRKKFFPLFPEKEDAEKIKRFFNERLE